MITEIAQASGQLIQLVDDLLHQTQTRRLDAATQQAIDDVQNFKDDLLARRLDAVNLRLDGLPPLFLELPPDVPAGREAEYQTQAEAIIGDARGTMPNGTRIHTVDSGARGQNPFAEHLRYQDEMIVLAATGGKLTTLAEPGSGTLAGSAHQRAFDDLTESEAAALSEIFQQQFDQPLLREFFPGQPQLAYFELAATRSPDPADVIDQALKLSQAGYEIDAAELSEKTGYRLARREYPLTSLTRLPATEDAA